MKKYLLSSFLLLAVIFALKAQSGLCDTNYWNHTYSNARLKIYDSCTVITGVIKNMIPPTPSGDYLFGTGDGDYHIYVEPDSAFTWMVTWRDSNYTKLCQGDDSGLYVLECATCINVEEVCKGTVTDAGALGDTEMAACMNFTDTVYLPNIGEHVQVTGPFIYDTVHCWNELHPVSRMLLINVTNIPEPEGSTFLDGMKLFPQPADKEVSFEFARPPHSITFIKIYNSVGNQLYVYGLAETSLLYIDVSHWAAGEYPYTIVSAEENKVLKNGVISVVR